MKTDPLCPSAPGEAGASLIGIIEPSGRSSHLVTPLVVDDAFLAAAGADGDVAKRFRFSAPCAEAGCQHWRDSACSLVGALRQRADQAGVMKETSLPRCAIRPQCRWWQQDGAQACSICAWVVHDPTPG